MYKNLFVGLCVLLLARPALAQTYRPNQALGKTLSKIKPLAMPNNAGGKNILENSCIFKNNGFSLSASEQLLDQCNIPEAIGQFVEKNGQPAHTEKAPGNLRVLEYFLLFKGNQYHIKFFVGCDADRTTIFSKVECINEKNRIMPGRRKGPGGRPGGRP